MKKSIREVKDSILRLLNEVENRQLPRRLVEHNFSTQYDIEEIRTAISTLIDDFVIDLVIDYPSDNSGLNTGRPHWFLRILSPAECQELRELPPLKLSLLRILQETDDEQFPGEVPVHDVRAKLIAKGFPEDKVEWVHIADRVDRVSVTSDNGLIPCYMIIPEYEKTEEYKKEQEQMWEESTKKEMFRMYIADIHDLAYSISKVVRASPDGISRTDIISRLFKSDPEYLKAAFEIATEEDEILPITLDNGEDGYKLNPDFENED